MDNIDELLRDLRAADLIMQTEEGWKVNPSAALLYRSLGFDDIAIGQNRNVLSSRLDADISSEVIRGVKLKIPLMAANMSTVTNVDFCAKLNKLGCLGVLHRAWSNTDDYLTEAAKMEKNAEWRAASVGVGNDDQYTLVDDLQYNGVNIIFIDIAHGWSEAVYDMANYIKLKYSQVKVVVGNVNNVEALYDFDDVADAIKVGIANGLACATKDTAGCVEGQASVIMKFRDEAKRLGMPIISDGGIRKPADFSKAMACGAGSVMMGSVFASCDESAAYTMLSGHKVYSGMASLDVQTDWRGGLKPGTCAEGITIHLDPTGPVADTVARYAGALRSAITYAGAVDVASLQKLARFIRIK